jgi:histidine ammonia-lyase
MTVAIDGKSLTLEGLHAVAVGREKVELSVAARARMAEAREVVLELLERGDPVYGLTTGLAERKRVELTGSWRRKFSEWAVRSHRVAQGPLASAPVVRATMLSLLNAYAKGASGVRPELAAVIVDTLNSSYVPEVRTLGSVGEADLGPMADLASSLLDRGELELEENEGLALLNSNAFSTGSAALAVLEAEQLLSSADVAAALDLEAFGANLSPLHRIVAELRPHPGVRVSIDRLHLLLGGSSAWERGWARNLQDPLTFRCIPQIHGAARDTLSYARQVVETEVNSAQGNPAVSIEERRAISVGNFDAIALAAALDFARISLAPVLTSATERTVKLLQAPVSGLPAGLAASPQTGEDALAEFAVASQALTAEARSLAHPVSFEVVSSMKAEGIEDRMTMAPLSAKRLAETVFIGSRVLAIELTVAAQAVELRPLAQLGSGTAAALKIVRRHVPPVRSGELPPHDLEPLVESVRLGEFAGCR